MSDTGTEPDVEMRDRVAVVTGASQGIGEAVARLFAESGMRLVLTDLTDDVEAVAADLARAYPGSGAVADVTDAEACDTLVATAVSRHGGVDVLAHATAVPQRQAPVADLALDEWDHVMAVNAKGAFLLSRSVLPVLPRPGARSCSPAPSPGWPARPGGPPTARPRERCGCLPRTSP